MTEPRYLPQIKPINDLPISQHALSHLKQLKLPVDSQSLYCVQLLTWALEKKELDLPEGLKAWIEQMPDQEPNKVAEFLNLEEQQIQNGPAWTAQQLAEELKDRALELEV